MIPQETPEVPPELSSNSLLYVSRWLQDHQLTLSALLILIFVYEREHCTPSEISTDLSMPSATVSFHAKNLLRGSLLEGHLHSYDRRSTVYAVTVMGRNLLRNYLLRADTHTTINPGIYPKDDPRTSFPFFLMGKFPCLTRDEAGFINCCSGRPTPITRIAEKLNISPTKATTISRSLQEHDFVYKIPCSRDKRVTMLRLTEKASDLFDEYKKQRGLDNPSEETTNIPCQDTPLTQPEPKPVPASPMVYPEQSRDPRYPNTVPLQQPKRVGPPSLSELYPDVGKPRPQIPADTTPTPFSPPKPLAIDLDTESFE